MLSAGQGPIGVQCYVGSNTTSFRIMPTTVALLQGMYLTGCASGVFRCQTCSPPPANPLAAAVCGILAGLPGQACSASDIAEGRSVFAAFPQNASFCGMAAALAGQGLASGLQCCATDVCNSPPPPQTPPPITSQFVVRLALLLPMTRAQFDATAQLLFRRQIAVAAGMQQSDAGRVALAIGDGRRRLLAGVAVNVTISMANASAAQAASGMLTQASINAALQAVGLPQATLLSPPTVVTISSPQPFSAAAVPPRPRAITWFLAAVAAAAASAAASSAALTKQ